MKHTTHLPLTLALCCLLPALGTSCDDMLDPESDLVMYEEDNRLAGEGDTLYSVLGVVHLMQQVADRTNLLGEVRADLVSLTASASTDLQQLADFTAGADNVYNNPQDYYAIINNCNYFIQTADTAYRKRGRPVFGREMAVMHTFRAWAYLQLAVTYGDVPFYTHFISTASQADLVMQQPRRSLRYLCDTLIADLTPWADTEPLDYGAMSSYATSRFFIPVRLMLGELCLWAGRYHEAAQWYHDWLADVDRPHPLPAHSVRWIDRTFPPEGITSNYTGAFALAGEEVVCYIPMEATAFEGTISDLPNLYQSTNDNDGYFELTWSSALRRLSAAQPYYYVYVENGVRDTLCVADSLVIGDAYELAHGDLRLYASVARRTLSSSTTSRYNTAWQTVAKVGSDVVLYRLGTVYLHYAEALNLAGCPTAAMAVLKYGLTYDALERGYVHPREQADFANLITFNRYTFTPTRVTGLHARGSGDADANPAYVLPQPDAPLPSWADTVAFWQPVVEDLLADETALETAFEGQRFYHLMRIALRRGDPAYLADRVARRDDPDQPDPALRARLLDPANWYLPLQ